MKILTLTTGKMAKYIGVSPDFLRKNKGTLFQEGIHYNRPNGVKMDMWVVDEMEKWVLGNVEISQTAKQVLDYVL